MFTEGNHLRVFRCYFVPAMLIFFAWCLASCGGKAERNDAWYDSLIERSYRATGHLTTPQLVLHIDSLYYSSGNPDDYFTIRKLGLHSSYCYEHYFFDSAAVYIDSQVSFIEKNNLQQHFARRYSWALQDRGNYYFNAGNMDKAFEYYTRSRAVQLTIKDDTSMLSDQSYRLGMVAYRQQQYVHAADYFKQSVAEMKYRIADSFAYYRKQELFNNIGLSYSKAAITDSSTVYYKRALAFIDTEGAKYNASADIKRQSEMARGVVLGNMAKVYLAQNNNDSAESLLLRSVAINTQPNHEIRDATFCYMQLAELYYNTGRYNKVLPILTNIKHTIDTLPTPEVDLRMRHLLYTYYNHVNNPVAALRYLQSYDQLKDSADAELKTLKGTNYSGMLKEQETQYQIKLLKKDNQLNKAYLYITFGLTLIAIIIVALVYFNYRKSRRNVLLLTSLNTQVNEQKIQLEDAMELLKSSNEDKDRILRIVAHDLRTPINGIMMLGDCILEEEPDQEKIESLNMIIAASKNLMHLTNELLEFSGNSKMISATDKEDTELNELGRQVVGLLQFKANEKQQKITLTQAASPIHLSVYREKINRVISNLITNAIKFSKEGSEIKVTIAQNEKTVLITVADNGIGIPEKMLPIVFDTFTNAQRHGTAGERSYGLGLSICRQIINAHHGRIWVESTEGVGSVFFIELGVEVEG